MVENKTQIEQTKRLYIQGKLTPEETVEFENYFLDKPELIEQLELEMALKQHLPAVGLETQRTQETAKTPVKFGWLTKVIDSLRQPLTVSVATAVVCAVSFSWYWQGQQGFEGSGKVSLVYVSPMRDITNEQQATLSVASARARGDEQVTLVLQPSLIAQTQFMVNLVNPQGKQLLEFTEVNTQGMGDLVITVPIERLTQGVWTIELKPKGQTQSVEKLLLNITE